MARSCINPALRADNIAEAGHAREQALSITLDKNFGGGIKSMNQIRRELICLQVRPPANKSAPMLHTHPSFFPL
jgi:hypothetical protein